MGEAKLGNSIERLAAAVSSRFSFDLSRNGSRTVTIKPLLDNFSEIPDEILNWFRLGISGGWIPPFEFLRPDQVVAEFKQKVSLYKELNESSGEPGFFHDDIIGGDPDPGLCLCKDSWSSGWLPIAKVDANMAFVDLTPGPNGTKGQVVYMYADEMALEIQGESISNWFDRIAMAIEAGKFEEFLIVPSEMRN